MVCCETLERSPAQPSVYTWGALLSIQSACFSCLISNSHLWKNDINWKGARGFCNIWCMEYLCSLQSLALSCKWRWRWQKTTNENFPNMQQFVHFFLNLHSIEQAFQFVLLHCFTFVKKQNGVNLSLRIGSHCFRWFRLLICNEKQQHKSLFFRCGMVPV